MNRILLASLLGGLAAFLMGFVLWVALPVQKAATQEFKSEVQQDTQLSAWFSTLEQGEGTYFIPQIPSDESLSAEDQAAAVEAMQDQAEQGPYAVIHLWPTGVDMRNPMMMVKGLVLSILAAFLAASLLTMTRAGLSYFQRVLFVAGLGAFVSLVAPLTSVNYLLYPLEWGMVLVFDHVLTWLVCGLVIARVVPSEA